MTNSICVSYAEIEGVLFLQRQNEEMDIMAKEKKQKNKAESRIKKIWFDEKHSLSDHDLDSKKRTKKNEKKLRRVREENISWGNDDKQKKK